MNSLLIIHTHVYNVLLKVPQSVLQKSSEVYSKDKEAMAAMEIKSEAITPRKFKELTKEETLDACRSIEEGVLRVEERCFRIIKSDILQPKAIPYMIRLELAKENDMYFNQSGVESADIMPNVKRHNLWESEDYKSAMAEMKAKSDAFFDQFPGDPIAAQLKEGRDRRIKMRDTVRV